MTHPPIVTPDEARAAWKTMHEQEREALDARAKLVEARRALPMTRVEKAYRFEGSDGELSLAELFAGRNQLILYRFFFQPGVATYPAGGCPGCSIFIDGIAHPAHLEAAGVTFAIVSPAPQPEIAAWKRRMGWEHFPWYTAPGDFSTDFGMEDWYGLNMFLRDGDDVFHTYAILGTSDVDISRIGTTWSLLDLTALGQKDGSDIGSKLHDQYDQA